MNEIVVKRHSFDMAKNRLKEFSEKTEAELKIDKVETEGVFLGLGNHKVTGYELNERLETIQKHLIDANATNNKVIKVFREIYNALDALDKDYITSIVANVKAIEKTSNDVRVQQETLKQHNEKLANQQNKLDAHQVEIEKNVANISKIVTALKVFKEKLDRYNHLTDIDKIWNDCKAIQNEIRVQQNELDNLAATSENCKESIATLSKNLVDAEKYAADSRNLIIKLEDFCEEVSALDHLMEIDEIWKKNEEHQIRIKRVEQESKVHIDELNELEQRDSKMCESITSNTHEISLLKKYKDELSGISHLYDIDGMWNDIEDHTSKLIECEKRDVELTDTIQKNKEEVNEKIVEAVQAANVAVEILTKKVKYAYWIAGGSAGLAIVEMILLLMKVI